MVCTFFGHRDAPDSIKRILENTITDMLYKNNISMFYVGNNGNFDKMVQTVLSEISEQHPINYCIVLSSLNEKISKEKLQKTMLPEGFEKTPPRLRICWRNEWMIKNSDIVITYVTHPSSGASKYKQLAEKQNKTIISLI